MYAIILGIILKIFVCLFIIYVSQSIWSYLKDIYSTKKTKNLVNTQIDKYKKIINELQENKPIHQEPSISKKDLELMNNELISFMEET
jgi:uncharacterized protein involved in tolerance to divalent cations